MNRRGIIAGGNWIVDRVKVIDRWPSEEALATITEEARGNGGSPYNVLKDLARLGAPFPLEAVGLVGDDEHGRSVLGDCRAHRIDTRQLRALPGSATSYTDVMTVRGTGRRTFFHQRGANALLAPEHFDFTRTRARIFHLGYLLLLDALDARGADGRPRACEVLASAHRAGLLTSIDLVSAASRRFASIVLPTIPEVDYLFVNDYETECVTGLRLRRAGRIAARAVERAAQVLLRAGVRRAVFIHYPEGTYARSRRGAGLWQSSLKVAPLQIKGTVGAGDAFAAGVLYGLHENWRTQRCLLLGVAAAATSLHHPTCSAGVQPAASCFALAQAAGFQTSLGPRGRPAKG